MAGEIELVSDGEGVVVVGDRSLVQRFLGDAGLASYSEEFCLGRLPAIFKTASDVAKTASEVAEQSARYLKLTPESLKRLQDAGGLMKTKTKGVSHAMLGEPGKKSLKWLQVEDGPAALLTNPALLSGVSGLMSQFGQQAEAHELKALLVRMDEKLDDVRRAQRDAVLAKLDRAAGAIDEAMTIHRNEGDPSTLWAKVSGESSTLLEVQNTALRELAALADKVEGKSKTGELKRATMEIEREVGVQLSILARCFELQDEFRIVELDHVMATAPSSLDGHRAGVVEARERRRDAVVTRTAHLMGRMDKAGAIANANVLLHARAARSVISRLNSTAEFVDEFHAPLGIEQTREPLVANRWSEALRDPEQLKTASVEAGEKALVAGGTAVAGVVVLSKFVAKKK